MKINKQDHNFYNFDFNKICDNIEGDLKYLNTFCILGLYDPFAIFSNSKPNREKKHKDFVFLYILNHSLMISGLNLNKMNEHKYQNGIYCPKCKDVIYSVYRHDYRKCTCGDCMVDGGKDYFRHNGIGIFVRINLLNDEIIKL